jgi:hypothetical protein
MTLRTGKSGRYRYYTCCTKARQGETGFPSGRTVPMEKLDNLVAEYIEQRLLQPERLERLLSYVLDRRTDRAERRRSHIAELRKRAAEADAKLKRLYDAIENGIADLSDPQLKDRVAELKATRDQARLDAERAEDAIDRAGPTITPTLRTFARTARKRMRTENGGYRRDHLCALAQRIEVDKKELRIMRSKSALLRTLVAASSVKTASFGVPSSIPKWRPLPDSNGCCRRESTSDDAWRTVRGFREADAARLRYLSDDEALRLANVCAPDFRALVAVALFTGCRYRELAAMLRRKRRPPPGFPATRPATKSWPSCVSTTWRGLPLLPDCTRSVPGSGLKSSTVNGKPWAKSDQQRPLTAACKAAKIDPPVNFHG